MEAATGHDLHYFSFKAPAGFLAQGQLAAQFSRGNTLFIGAHEVDNIEGFKDREFYFVKQGIAGRAGLVATFGALSGMF
jgi:hypothetical protein